ncbi:MAG: L-fucose:H+ symporter permease [Acidobacteria bacterium]|jgi:FHS family L-fucose permease-like MFS transporter|nr:L-fucose:H+ symporter permease [Acidobacteriota bacterium]
MLPAADPTSVAQNDCSGNRLDAPLLTRATAIPFVLITTLFFLWAIPNNLNDVLIRQFMKSFVMTRLEAGLVQFAFYLGYFFLALPAGFIMRKFGYKSGFLIGLSFFTLGAFLFWPAALANNYSFFLAALFIIASGCSFLETASNPFIAQLGDPRSAARRLNLAQAFNPLGSITGVLIGTIFIFSGINLNNAQIAAKKASHTYAAYLHSETLRVANPYLVLSAFTFILLLLIAMTRFPDSLTASQAENSEHGSIAALFRKPHFVMAVLAQFAYVGAQVGTWSYFIPYVVTYTPDQNKAAGYLLTVSLVAFGIGRFLSAWLMRYVHPSLLMGVYCIANTLLVAGGVFFPGWFGVWTLLLSSFFMSLMYPTIFAQGIRGLGEYAKIGGSVIVMSIVGGALMPLAMGYIADSSGSQALAYLVPFVAYIFIGVYSFADLRIMRRGRELSLS